MEGFGEMTRLREFINLSAHCQSPNWVPPHHICAYSSHTQKAILFCGLMVSQGSNVRKAHVKICRRKAASFALVCIWMTISLCGLNYKATHANWWIWTYNKISPLMQALRLTGGTQSTSCSGTVQGTAALTLLRPLTADRTSLYVQSNIQCMWLTRTVSLYLLEPKGDPVRLIFSYCVSVWTDIQKHSAMVAVWLPEERRILGKHEWILGKHECILGKHEWRPFLRKDWTGFTSPLPPDFGAKLTQTQDWRQCSTAPLLSNQFIFKSSLKEY
jgi:hypothetical protein